LLSQCLEQFGFEHGRVIGMIPKKWREEVIKQFREKHVDDKRLEDRLVRIAKKGVLCRVPLDSESEETWVDRATKVDPQFVHGIITCDKNIPIDPRVISEHDLHDENPIWNVETGSRSQRVAETMAEMTAVLLRYSREVKFVDAYYCGEKSHVDFVIACLRTLEAWPKPNSLSIEIHFRYRRDTRDDELNLQSKALPMFNTIVDKTKAAFSTFLKRHRSVTLFQWAELEEGGDRFHERFVITDKAAIDFGGGLDTGNDSQKTTVKLMGKSAHEELNNMYRKDTESFLLLNHAEI
jgi:hypothetical protein